MRKKIVASWWTVHNGADDADGVRHKAPLSACKAGENTPGRSPQPSTAFFSDREFDVGLWRRRSLLLFLRLHFARLMDRWTGSRGVSAVGGEQRAATGTLTGPEWGEGCLRPGRWPAKRPCVTKLAPKVWNRARLQGTAGGLTILCLQSQGITRRRQQPAFGAAFQRRHPAGPSRCHHSALLLRLEQPCADTQQCRDTQGMNTVLPSVDASGWG